MTSEAKSAELLPCPFCGGEPDLNDYTEKPAGGWVLSHKNHGCIVRFVTTFPSIEAATARWNRRARLSPGGADGLLDSHIDALKADAESMGREGAHYAVIAAEIEALRARVGVLEKIANRPLIAEPGKGDFGKDRERCPSCHHAWHTDEPPHHASNCDREAARQALQHKDPAQ